LKITDVKVERFIWSRKVAITNGKHTYPQVKFNVVTITTNEGITGYGYGHVDFVHYFREMLIGQDPLNNERLWDMMWVPKLVGRRGLSTRSISAIDIALWDIKAKFAGLPLYKLLGAHKDKVPAYIAGGYYAEGKDLKALQEEMQLYVSWGARAVKMKIGALPLREDAERVKAVREAIGPDIKLMIDANCAYKQYEAITFAKMVEEYDPFWFEEPVMPDDLKGMKRLAEATTIPIATGENEYTRYGFRDLIENNAVPILNADAFILGGITEWLKVAALAQAYDLQVAPHGSQIVHVHLVSAAPNGLILEYYPEQFDPMLNSSYTRKLALNPDGTVTPPQVPGLGFEPNYEALEPYRQ
jgi:L-alanine-DL-glutamate epimerase-like enolase superfamily enzyme